MTDFVLWKCFRMHRCRIPYISAVVSHNKVPHKRLEHNYLHKMIARPIGATD